MRNKKDILTTTEVSILLSMSSKTVCRLVDDGWLPGWRIPGSLHRRISRRALEAFIKEHNMITLNENEQLKPS